MELRAMTSTMVSGSNDPEPVFDVVKVKQRVQILAQASSAAPYLLTVGAISRALPVVNAWASMRVVKVSFWGNDESTLRVFMRDTVTQAGELDDSAVSFNDIGVPGSRRAALHIVPSFGIRLINIRPDVTDESNDLAQVLTTATSAIAIVMNITVELVSKDVIGDGFKGFRPLTCV